MTGNELPNANDLITTALQLPLRDRVMLANAILESMGDSVEQISQSEVDESWNDEIASRIEQFKTGQVSTVSSSKVWDRIGGKPNA